MKILLLPLLFIVHIGSALCEVILPPSTVLPLLAIEDAITASVAEDRAIVIQTLRASFLGNKRANVDDLKISSSSRLALTRVCSDAKLGEIFKDDMCMRYALKNMLEEVAANRLPLATKSGESISSSSSNNAPPLEEHQLLFEQWNRERQSKTKSSQLSTRAQKLFDLYLKFRNQRSISAQVSLPNGEFVQLAFDITGKVKDLENSIRKSFSEFSRKRHSLSIAQGVSRKGIVFPSAGSSAGDDQSLLDLGLRPPGCRLYIETLTDCCCSSSTSVSEM